MDLGFKDVRKPEKPKMPKKPEKAKRPKRLASIWATRASIWNGALLAIN